MVISRQLGIQFNAYSVNGLNFNGIHDETGSVRNGYRWNGANEATAGIWDTSYFTEFDSVPSKIAPLGSNGVGDLTEIGFAENILDNRHVDPRLVEQLCTDVSLREFFATLIELAWPDSAQFHLGCSSSVVLPDYIFSSFQPDTEPLALAPHFLTEQFGVEQQQALTAAFIAKINVHGTKLMMDIAGFFDLGAGGTKLITRDARLQIAIQSLKIPGTR